MDEVPGPLYYQKDVIHCIVLRIIVPGNQEGPPGRGLTYRMASLWGRRNRPDAQGNKFREKLETSENIYLMNGNPSGTVG